MVERHSARGALLLQPDRGAPRGTRRAPPGEAGIRPVRPSGASLQHRGCRQPFARP
jgi:hypothetical protein